eukprot:5186-Heterococcus_DN1.PRE.4
MCMHVATALVAACKHGRALVLSSARFTDKPITQTVLTQHHSKAYYLTYCQCSQLWRRCMRAYSRELLPLAAHAVVLIYCIHSSAYTRVDECAAARLEAECMRAANVLVATSQGGIAIANTHTAACDIGLLESCATYATRSNHCVHVATALVAICTHWSCLSVAYSKRTPGSTVKALDVLYTRGSCILLAAVHSGYWNPHLKSLLLNLITPSLCKYEHLHLLLPTAAYCCCALSIPLHSQLANIYVTVTAGSIFKAVEAILRKPDTVLGLLGGALPLVAVYFTNLIIVKVVGGLMMELCFGGRPLKFWRILCIELFTNPKLRTKEDRTRGVFEHTEPWYGRFFADFTLVLMVVFICEYYYYTYSV